MNFPGRFVCLVFPYSLTECKNMNFHAQRKYLAGIFGAVFAWFPRCADIKPCIAAFC